jgi:hypothetical protein
VNLSARDLRTSIVLAAGHVLTVVADAISAGTLTPSMDPGGAVTISEGDTVTAGPFEVDTPYEIECTAGTLVHSCSLWVESRIPEGLVWLSGAGAPVDYTDGDPVATGDGVAGKGSLYSDVTAGALYINKGTAAEPSWKQLAEVA